MNGTLAAVIEMSMALSVLSAAGSFLAWKILRQTELIFWSFSWLSLCARLGFDLLRTLLGESALLWLATDVFMAVSAVIPLLGLLETARIRITISRWMWAVPGWALAWGALALATGLPPLPAELPGILPAALCFPAGSLIILRSRRFSMAPVRWPLAAGWLAIGFLIPHAPWMSQQSAGAPVGFAVLGLLTLAVAICTLTLTFQDVLDRSRESDLRSAAAARTMRDIIEASPLAIISVDLAGKVQSWNSSAERILGWKEEEVKGRPLPRLHADDPGEMEGHILKTIQGVKAANAELRRTRRDGSSVFLSMSTVVLRAESGAISGALAVIADLTTHRLYRETIADQLRLLDSAMDAIIVRATDERLLYCNEATVKLYGYSREELRDVEIVDLLMEEDVPKFEEARKICIRRGEWEGELCQRDRNGRTIIVHSRWSLVRDNAGFPKARLVINRDISAQKELEKQLRRTQRMESLGALASGIAHDLNNILSPILMSVDVLKMRYTAESDQRLLQMLATSVNRGSDIVRQMLSFARGSEGEPVPLQLRHVVREIEMILSATFPKSIQVLIDIPRDLPLVLADATQIHQLLLNLCVNSRDAMPEGGRIEIHAQEGTLPERNEHAAAAGTAAARAGQCVRLTVTDNGAGIPAEIRERIFEPFFTTKDMGKGTGLGLSTVLSIVHNHGGSISCTSEVGRGTTFEICLPTAPAGEGEANPEEPEAAIPLGAGEAVLVIDDDVSVLHITRQILENFGYTVFSAESGPVAVELLRDRLTGGIRLILTDMDMPSMDGAAAVTTLRKITPGVPVILMSGLPPVQDSAAVTALDVNGVIGKPFRAQELLTMVRDVLDAHAAARADRSA